MTPSPDDAALRSAALRREIARQEAQADAEYCDEGAGEEPCAS